jgi:iron-sulfur cluster repair protein YtfE (RIC family)
VSTSDPIDRLLGEHRSIMAGLEGMRRAMSDLDQHGEAALSRARPALAAAGALMERELIAHARREDEALFPAVEAALGESAGPTAAMRAEHIEIHSQAEHFRRTLRELDEVEHPALKAAGARLRNLTASGAGASDLRDSGREVIRLLDAHFEKEEQILFPMARGLLDRDALEAVARRMHELDSR